MRPVMWYDQCGSGCTKFDEWGFGSKSGYGSGSRTKNHKIDFKPYLKVKDKEEIKSVP